MGRFKHEAVAVDPASGCIYETEDMGDGLIYRFIPRERDKLAAGGRLQALMVRAQRSVDLRNWQKRAAEPGQPMEVAWVDMEDVLSPKDDLRKQGLSKGAAVFARNEGMWYGRDSVFFCATNGGSKQKGQIWRYTPSPAEGTPEEEKQPGKLELFIESTDGRVLENADNITVAPWGDLIVCEDEVTKSDRQQFLVGITPQGKCYHFARNAMNVSEFAGATFSPDGTTLFVNIQRPGLTLAITGPWRKA
jgi:secreted PhoX family phosphatase